LLIGSLLWLLVDPTKKLTFDHKEKETPGFMAVSE
jgi:hypothetical protein